MASELPECVATVSSRDFLVGTRVLFDSFLTHNSWFEGKLVVIHRDISERDQAAILREFPQVEFQRPAFALEAALKRLISEQPRLTGRAARFLSLQCLWMNSPGRVLFCDSDILFRKDVREDLMTPGLFLACPDFAQLVTSAVGPTTKTSFNSGLMLIDRSRRSTVMQQQALMRLDPIDWRDSDQPFTDQAVFNHVFGDEVQLLGSHCNHLVGLAAKLRETAHGPLREAKVLHFNGPAKPWAMAQHRSMISEDPGFATALAAWFAAYSKSLVRSHFAARANGRESEVGVRFTDESVTKRTNKFNNSMD